MEHYIFPPDQFRPANAYKEWKSVLGTLDTLLEVEARVSAWDSCNYKNTLRILRAIVKHRSENQIYLWLHDIWETATKGTETAFEGIEVTEEDVPDRIQYWSLNIDIGLNDRGLKDLNITPDFSIAGLFLVPLSIVLGKSANADTSPRGFVTGLLLQPNSELSNRVNQAMEANDPLPPEEWVYRFRFGNPIYSDQIVPHEDRGTLAAIRFLKEKFVEPQQQFLPRSEKRREQKEGLSVPDIRSVLLRARANDAVDAMTDEQQREYACHFLVSSHWRRPSERMKEKRPVFVTSYVKGNTEKPFRPPRESIYHVAR